jgi:probable phosphoglycerate mutase
MRLLIWRHGQTAWNAQGRIQGQRDVPLDEVGRAQATAAAPHIAALNPSLVISSDLSRARDTAGALGLPLRTDPRLRETDFGSWSGLTHDEAEAADPETFRLWKHGVDVARGGRETMADVAVRAAAVVDELDAADPGALVVIVTHGGTARALVGTLLKLPQPLWERFGGLDNCRWSLIVPLRYGGGWRLAEHNTGVRVLPTASGSATPAASAVGSVVPGERVSADEEATGSGQEAAASAIGGTPVGQPA